MRGFAMHTVGKVFMAIGLVILIIGGVLIAIGGSTVSYTHLTLPTNREV